MILYFSSTGNCLHVAKRIAEKTGDQIASVGEVKQVELSAGEQLGFVFPTYFWALPKYVEQYMRQLAVSSPDREPYVYFIATYGTTCGGAGKEMTRHMKRKSIPLSALYSVKMPDDWTPWFDLSDPARVAEINEEADKEIDEVAAEILAQRRGDRIKSKMPHWMTFFSLRLYDIYRRTKRFTLEDSCISCGKCAAECPEGAIEIQAGKPVWVKPQCTLCLHCLHTCPTFAIQYGRKTKKHGQYYHP